MRILNESISNVSKHIIASLTEGSLADEIAKFASNVEPHKLRGNQNGLIFEYEGGKFWLKDNYSHISISSASDSGVKIKPQVLKVSEYETSNSIAEKVHDLLDKIVPSKEDEAIEKYVVTLDGTYLSDNYNWVDKSEARRFKTREEAENAVEYMKNEYDKNANIEIY